MNMMDGKRSGKYIGHGNMVLKDIPDEDLEILIAFIENKRNESVFRGHNVEWEERMLKLLRDKKKEIPKGMYW